MTESTATAKQPSVLFVCSKNGGKSQIAAGLMNQLAGGAVSVHSAGTRPGMELNAESVASLLELGVDIAGEHPKPVTDEMLDAVDVVVVLGTEAKLEPHGTARFETWETDEPSARGIEGMERMRLLRDDIKARVESLFRELATPKVEDRSGQAVTNYELRIIPECPNSGPALDLMRRTLEVEGIPADRLAVRVVASEDEAVELGFHGSPSFIAAGRDLFPSQSEPALSCRVYPSGEGMSGLPSPEALRNAVHGTRPGLEA